MDYLGLKTLIKDRYKIHLKKIVFYGVFRLHHLLRICCIMPLQELLILSNTLNKIRHGAAPRCAQFDAGKERIYTDVTEPAFTLHNSNINK